MAIRDLYRPEPAARPREERRGVGRRAPRERALSVWAGGHGQPDAFSALFFTNYAWHWDGERPAGLPAHVVALPDETRVPLPPGEFKLIEEALSQWELPGTAFTEAA